MASSDRVARYYDRNTLRFLWVGARGSYAIHRQLWGPGVGSVRDAANYLDVLIAKEIGALIEVEDLAILDIGCGVGGTLFHLAHTFPRSRLHGITISQRQYEIANRLRSERGLDGRCRFTQGDFDTMALGAKADAVVAVESFVHSGSPGTTSKPSNFMRTQLYLRKWFELWGTHVDDRIVS